MPAAELRGELVVGGSFIAAAVALYLLGNPHQALSLPLAALYVVGLAVAAHVRFDVGVDFTVPTQAVFVPMLFALPVAAVPLLVALALGLSMAPAILRGRVPASRILTVPGNSWFAMGPSIVLLVAHDHVANGHWTILLVALVAQFACDFTASAVRNGLFEDITGAELMEEFRQTVTVDVALSTLGLVVALAVVTAHSQLAVLLLAPTFGVLRQFSNERRARLEQLIELNDAYQGTALLLGDVVEADDAYTGEHCKSVVRLAVDVARELHLGVDEQRNVEFGALLHDVGKIAVPKEIVNKPGRLDAREWAIIRTHTIEGQKMLERIGGLMRAVGKIVRSSHEHWDGNGYPDGLRGDEIPIESRIIATCDAFNAMTTNRSYRVAMPAGAAIDELQRHAGSQFDPEVVRTLLRVL